MSFAGLTCGSMPAGLWHDPTVLRKMDLEVVMCNLRAHLEMRFEEHSQMLAQLIAEQKQTNELQERCVELLEAPRPAPTIGKDPALCVNVESETEDSDDGQSVVIGSAMTFANITPTCHHAKQTPHLAQASPTLDESSLAYYFNLFKEFVESPYFDHSMGVVIVLNVILLGAQVDIRVRDLSTTGSKQEPAVFGIIETVFACIFLLELLARLVTQNLRFCRSFWNLFDMFVVASAWVEEIIKYGIGGDTLAGKLSMFRVIRVVKILRALRVIRVVRAFGELRIILASVTKCLRSLFWTSCLFFVFMYFVAVILLVELSGSDSPFAGDDAHAAVRREYFSSLARTLLTMYQCVSGGLVWGDVTTALESVLPWISAVWVVFVGIVSFAVSNLITGIFVDQAMKSAREDKRNVDIEEFDDRRQAVMQLAKINKCASRSSSVGRGTLRRCLNDKRFRVLLKLATIDPRDLVTFFDLAAGGKKRLPKADLECFYDACLRLTGFARSMDVAALHFAQMRASWPK